MTATNNTAGTKGLHMFETLITFKVLTDDRELITKTLPIKHDFREIPACVFHGVELPPTTVEEQVMTMLDEMDKREMMDENGWYMIIDYWPKKKRVSKTDELKDFMKFCEPYITLYPSLKRPFEAIISDYKDVLFGKGKSNEAKFKEVTRMIEVAQKATLGVIDSVNKRLDAILKGDSPKKTIVVNPNEIGNASKDSDVKQLEDLKDK